MSCSICSRPDVEALRAALLAAASREPGAESLNAISKRTGLRKETLIRHRDECLEAPESASEPVRTTPGPPPDRGGPQAEPGVGPSASPFAVPNPGDDPPTAPRKVVAAKLEQEAVDLRAKGKSHEQIAAHLSIAVETSVDLVERYLVRPHRVSQKREVVLQLELERIDRLIAGLWERATDPAMAVVEVPADTETGVRAYDGQDKAVDRVTKLLERRAKLLGLDVPAGPSTVVNIHQNPAVNAALAVMREVLDRLHPGASADVTAGYLAWTKGGTPGLARWLEGRAGALILEAPQDA